MTISVTYEQLTAAVDSGSPLFYTTDVGGFLQNVYVLPLFNLLLNIISGAPTEVEFVATYPNSWKAQAMTTSTTQAL